VSAGMLAESANFLSSIGDLGSLVTPLFLEKILANPGHILKNTIVLCAQYLFSFSAKEKRSNFYPQELKEKSGNKIISDEDQ
jgi:hypothetical protein